jgi:hypothetical protein
VAWNITNFKWLPQPLQPIYNQYVGGFVQAFFPSDSVQTLQKWLDVNETTNFMQTTVDFWCSMVPLTVVSFFTIHIVLHFMKNNWFKRFLIRFTVKATVLVSIFGDNVQYLSFRCFSQLYDISINPQAKIFSTLNLTMSYIVLICTLAFVCVFYVLLKYIENKQAYVFAEGFKRCNRGYFYLAQMNAMRFLLGALHAILYLNSSLQI